MSAMVRGGKIERIIRKAYNDLGPVRFGEWAVLGHFIVLVLLWIFLDPKFIPGWASLFKSGYVKGSTPAVVVSISLFMFPSERLQNVWNRKRQEMQADHNTGDDPDPVQVTPGRKKLASIPALLHWQVIHEKMPWDVLLIVGGGFALADGCQESGLSSWMAEKFTILRAIAPPLMAIIISCITSLITEIMSNVVTATILLPILAQMGEAMLINPLYLMLSCSVAASFAFMLPVATAPNAIAFASKEIKVLDMVKTGCVLNILCILVSTLSINTLGRLVFQIHVFPDWASGGAMNSTMMPEFTFTNSTVM